MDNMLGTRRLTDPRHEVGAGLAAALAVFGGVGLWIIAAAGVPAAVPVQYGPLAWLIPFAAGPAALCAAWSALGLWRAGRRTPAALAFFAAAAALLLGLPAAAAQEVRSVVLLSIVVPLVVAHLGNVALLRGATRFGARSGAGLLAVAALPLVAGGLGWPGPLWSVAAVLPVVLVTPLLAAAFLTGALLDGRPRGAPLPALAFFGLPLALLAGTGLAAGVSALSGVFTALLLPLVFWFGPPLALLLVLVAAVLVGLRVLAATHVAPAALAAPVAPAIPAPRQEPIAPPATGAMLSTVQGAERRSALGTVPLVPSDERRSRALLLFTDHFLAGHLSNGEYERQLDHLLRPRADGKVAVVRARPERIAGATEES